MLKTPEELGEAVEDVVPLELDEESPLEASPVAVAPDEPAEDMMYLVLGQTVLDKSHKRS